MASANLLEESLSSPLPIHRFTVEQYRQMGELGVLTPDDRVELLEGLIVEKMNQRPIHGYIVGLMTEWFQQKLSPGWIVRCQLPITTARSEPEPDLTILKGNHVDFRHHHPVGKDCRLLIEVADTSLEKDRAKAKIYREAGVQEYWMINLPNKVLERYVFSGAEGIETPSTESETIDVSGTVCFNIDGCEVAMELKVIFE